MYGESHLKLEKESLLKMVAELTDKLQEAEINVQEMLQREQLAEFFVINSKKYLRQQREYFSRVQPDRMLIWDQTQPCGTEPLPPCNQN